MSQRNSTKSGRSSYDFPIAYDSEICIEICRQLILGKDLQVICSKPPMPPGQVFLGWVQDHTEAREIHRSAQNFKSDRILAKQLGVPLAVSVIDRDEHDWEEQVRANVHRGCPADWVDREYIPPDWSKVFPLIGGPPVGSTENMQAYNDLLNAYTEMLEPRDLMELGWTKEAADAAWEAQAVTALDYGALRARSKNYERVDRTRMRAIKRRDNALRQIEKWRKGLGAKPRRLPDHLIVEDMLARRYGVEQPPAEADSDGISAGTPDSPAVSGAFQTSEARSFAPQAGAADAGPPFAVAAEAAEAGIAATPVHPTVETTVARETSETPPAVRRADGAADADPSFAMAAEPAQSAPSLAAGDGAVPAAPIHPTGETTGATPASQPTDETAAAEQYQDPGPAMSAGDITMPIRSDGKSEVVVPMKHNQNRAFWQNEPKSSRQGSCRDHRTGPVGTLHRPNASQD